MFRAEDGSVEIESLEKAFFSRHRLNIVPALKKARVGVAGAGGLGSNVAVALARSGVGRLVIADFDRVEPHNLNRQQYFVDQIGEFKVEALKKNLTRINPFSEYEVHRVFVDADNMSSLYDGVDIMVEAFDSVESKVELLERWVEKFPDKPLVMGSGMGGYGNNNLLNTKRLFENVYVCGDGKSDVAVNPPLAPRVAIVAGMQANLVLELLLNEYVVL
jgi:sulfur carrier protein ThiS adenylyltransferase